MQFNAEKCELLQFVRMRITHFQLDAIIQKGSRIYVHRLLEVTGYIRKVDEALRTVDFINSHQKSPRASQGEPL